MCPGPESRKYCIHIHVYLYMYMCVYKYIHVYLYSGVPYNRTQLVKTVGLGLCKVL